MRVATAEETVELSPKEEADLLEAIAEADAGDFVSGEQVLEELRGGVGERSASPRPAMNRRARNSAP